MQEQNLLVDKIENESELPNQLICTICTSLITNPVQCKKCENMFCLNCINLWQNNSQKCPLCKENYQQQKPSRVVMNLYNQCILQCKDCHQRIQLEQFNQHMCNQQDHAQTVQQFGQLDVSSSDTEDWEELRLKKKECPKYKDLNSMGLNQYQYPENHKQWNCGICKVGYQGGASLQCNKCQDFKYCLYCLDQTEDYSNSIQLKLPLCTNCRKFTDFCQRPYENYPEDEGWECNKCNMGFSSRQPNAQCQKCEVDICFHCLDKY